MRNTIPPRTLLLTPRPCTYPTHYSAFNTEPSYDEFRVRGTAGAGCSFDSTRSGDFSPFSLTVPAACTSLQFSFVTDSTVVRSGVFVRAGPLGASPSVAPRAAAGGGGGTIGPIDGGAIAGIVIGVLIAVVVIPVLICIACCGGVAGACAACARGKALHQPLDSGGANTVVVMQNPVGLFAGHSSGGTAGHHGGMPPLSQPVYDYSASHAPSFSYPPPAFPPPAAYPAPPQHPHFAQYPPQPQTPPAAQHQPFYPPPPNPYGNAV